jgi:hypothetical protein
MEQDIDELLRRICTLEAMALCNKQIIGALVDGKIEKAKDLYANYGSWMTVHLAHDVNWRSSGGQSQPPPPGTTP